MKRRPERSLATKLSLWVALTSAIVLLVVSLVIDIFVAAGIIMEADRKADGEVDNVGDHIDKVLIEVETAVRNTLPMVQNNLQRPELFRSILEYMASNNPVIAGCSIAMEPNYYSGKKYYAPYVHKDAQVASDTLYFSMLDQQYDYFDHEWYADTKELDKPHWSNPYLDVGGGGFEMTTYSVPIHDRQGVFRGVLTADISLDWLGEIMSEVEMTESATVYMLSEDGTFLVSPRKELVMRKTIFDLEKDYPRLGEIGRKMLAGENGTSSFRDPDHGSMMAFYGPIPKNGWSMAIVCPIREFFDGLISVFYAVSVLEILGLVLITFVCYLVLRRLLKPLRKFAQSADEVAEGNLHAELPEIGEKNELWSLKSSFETMQNSLEQQMEQLKVVNEANGRIEGELQSARAIQESMLPKALPPFPDCPNVACSGSLTPAKEVGGDLYDVFAYSGKVFFCIGDVSGKGVPASLLMAVTRSLFHTMLNRTDRVSDMVSQMNDALSESNPQCMFVTLFAGILDAKTGKLHYCNAGHNAPLLIQKTHAEFLKVIPNLPLGVMHNWQFEEQETTLSKRDSLFLYTDGLTEAENQEKELFGENRALHQAQNFGTADTQTQIGKMSAAVAQFVAGAPQSDDLTLLSIQYLG